MMPSDIYINNTSPIVSQIVQLHFNDVVFILYKYLEKKLEYSTFDCGLEFTVEHLLKCQVTIKSYFQAKERHIFSTVMHKLHPN